MSQDVRRSLPLRHLTTPLAFALGLAGCQEGGGGPDDPETALFAAGLVEHASLFPSDASSLQATPPTQMLAFDFAAGNGPIEVIIPSVIPTIFANVKPGDATLVLRFTTLLTNCWFDAIAPYHPTAIGVESNLGRRPAGESVDNTNLNIAIFYASYRVLNSLAPQNKAGWDAMMTSVGLDPDDDHEGTDDAIGIGNAAGNAVVTARENDGFNQLGYEGRNYNPLPYSDYTGYEPKNTAYELKDERRWQPAIEQNAYGLTKSQHFVTPQYALTRPYSYDDPSEFSTPKPKKSYKQGPGGKQAYRAQADHVLEVSANLTDEQKMAAELFNDKIRSLGFAALFVTLSRGMSLMEFVHYDFLTNLAAFDVGIIVWQEKTRWDSVRPFSAIRHLYGDDEITAWGGPGMGTVDDITGAEWRSYLGVADHPEYPSGSSAFCNAHAQASRLYLGGDEFGWVVPNPAGSSLVEPGVTPAVDTDLVYETFTEFAETCGQSRVWGGVHFEDAVLASIPLGEEIGTRAYDFVTAHIEGNVP